MTVRLGWFDIIGITNIPFDDADVIRQGFQTTSCIWMSLASSVLMVYNIVALFHLFRPIQSLVRSKVTIGKSTWHIAHIAVSEDAKHITQCKLRNF